MLTANHQKQDGEEIDKKKQEHEKCVHKDCDKNQTKKKADVACRMVSEWFVWLFLKYTQCEGAYPVYDISDKDKMSPRVCASD